MAMVVEISQLTGAGPSVAQVTSVRWSLDDSASGTTPVPTPTATGTNFSYVKSFQIHITTTNSLTMTNVLFGKVAAEATAGTKLWYRSDHAVGSYVQATVGPASTGDNNTTAPVIPAGGNNSTVAAVPLISAPPSTYAAGPFTTTGDKGNLIEVTLGVDATNTTAGGSVGTPTLRWSWTES